MDLGAYFQIPNISDIAKANGIQVPRLRGYRLMKNEAPMDWVLAYMDYEPYIIEDLITDSFRVFNRKKLNMTEWGHIDSLWKKYIIGNRVLPKGIRWENIHGKKRKALRWVIHCKKEQCKKQYDTFNKYCGRDDVLYVHARIGGDNWYSYYDDVRGKLLERVDDAFDCTYCDLYFKIKGENYG